MTEPGLEAILRCAYGFWNSAILAAAFRLEIFDHLARGAADAQALAASAGISKRGSQAILDGLLGQGLIARTETGYANQANLERYLLRAGEDYLGGYGEMILGTLSDWAKLPQSVETGSPLHMRERIGLSASFWEHLVRAQHPLSAVPARVAARRLGVADRGAFRMLDVGGGSGVYSAIWLELNQLATSTQIDAPNINTIARSYLESSAAKSRFETVDADMEKVSLQECAYDYAVYSNMAHGLPDARNVAMLKRMRGWLKPSGTLVICSLIPNVSHRANSMLMAFPANLLLNSEHGELHSEVDYRSWLEQSGFSKIDFELVQELPYTLIYAT